MVAKEPFLLTWTAKKFQSTVINDIWPEVIFFTLVATMVALVSNMTSHSLAISNQMLTVLGIVLGLVVSFRTTSAYDRYWEGRKLWTVINLVSRNLALLIWIHVPNDREDKKKKTDDGKIAQEDSDEIARQAKLKAIIEKKTMVNLVQAFSVAVKHALRGEAGIYYEDLFPLVCFLPKFASQPPDIDREKDFLPLWYEDIIEKEASEPHKRPRTVHRALSDPGDRKERKAAEKHVRGDDLTTNGQDIWKKNREDTLFDPESVLPAIKTNRVLKPARDPPKLTVYDYLPLLLIFKPIVTGSKSLYSSIITRICGARKRSQAGEDNSDALKLDGRDALGRRKKAPIIASNVPLEITLFISSYLAWLLKNGLLQPAIATSFATTLVTMQDTMANLDRIRTTPIPFAYQAHLRMTMWIYLFFLPFQIFDAFNYLTIPATAFASYLLLGFLEIGQEIEDPFNYDLNDLDLDGFCLVIQRELAEITAHPSPAPESFVFGELNQPFAPSDRRSAKKIMSETDHDYHHHEIGVLSVRRALLNSWRDISDHTVHHPHY